MEIYIILAKTIAGKEIFLDCTDTWGNIANGSYVVFGYANNLEIGEVIMYPMALKNNCGNNITMYETLFEKLGDFYPLTKVERALSKKELMEAIDYIASRKEV